MARDKIQQKSEFDFSAIEKKWQKKWEDAKCFEVREDKKKKKFYVLEMYPYPSASGLHIGHSFNYTLGDIMARFKIMNGFNVLHPMGFDSFGLPAENAAIENKSHPENFTNKAIENFIKQQKALGLSYDWDRMLKSHDIKYYKWNQYFFLQFLKKGLAYKKKSAVNWCQKCNSVIANEEVHNGKCWRHKDIDVEIKHLEQWFLKTTAYADELYEKVKELDWPERIKAMQENWIGKSHGAEIDFSINGKKWLIFTTRADTIYGVTFMVVSAQHPKLMELVTKEQKKEVEAFLKRLRSVSEKELKELEKEGVFTGSYAINPINNEKIPVWAGNFVVADYGSGMVMAVPCHDQRDFEFAKKYNLPLKIVIEPITGMPREKEEFRKSIVAIVENPKNGKVLSVNWGEKLGGNLFIGGGIEKNEDEIETAVREIKEETGYKNVKFISKTEKIHHHYIAHSKNVNRNIEAVGLYFQLVNEEKNPQKLNKDEKNKFSVEWLEKSNVAEKVKDELHALVFRKLVLGEAYTGQGVLVNSSEFNGISSKDAINKITAYLEKKKLGRKVVNYKLRDWLLSRQRYWGTPIPVVYCNKCGMQPVPEKELPVILPTDVDFEEKGNALAKSPAFLNTKCPKCKGKAKRETDTMSTFFDSSWYFLRFCDNLNKKEPFDKKKIEYWMPVDFYIGGAEHACMHLIYARFFTKVFRDFGYVKFDEPFKRLFNQGMIHGEDGFVMSKSKGNVIDPLSISNKYGADTLRAFLVSVASPDKDFSWIATGIESMHKFVNKIYETLFNIKIDKSSAKTAHKVNKAVKEITHDIENWQFNIAVIKLRELIDSLESEISREDTEKIIKLISPFCPHIAEELWSKLGNKGFVSLAEWPKADESKINPKFEEAEKAIEKTKEDIINVKKIFSLELPITHIYPIPSEFNIYNENKHYLIKTTGSSEVIVHSLKEKNFYDPCNKSEKAKPGKPGIYLEPAGTSINL